MGMSYDRAWKLVRAMNELFRVPLVAVARGGGSGGGAGAHGRRARSPRAATRAMEKACRTATRRDWQTLTRLLR